ncbi:hypothetical protein HK097_002815 [Rhizophlyctis rosea]|uniref:CUE domain-containing protein n=1 Tax=Rhizophlyctis rosea TaxID=64517 RepID=A0AAD5X412_9FUNG|nr:hypothetical protein HK097_002815 [Rhizophlyctis rosea]
MEQIRAMFPDTDPELLESVYAANSDNLEETVNQLLELTSSGTVPAATNTTAAQPQSDRDALPRQPATAIANAGAGATADISADEALARALAQEEQDEAYARSLAQQEEDAARGQYYSQADRTNTEPDAVDKFITSASQLGEQAKNKFKELYSKTFTQPADGTPAAPAGPATPSASRGLNITDRLKALGKDGNSGGGVKTAVGGAGAGQRYSALPGDDFDPLLGDEEPLERKTGPPSRTASPRPPGP